MACKIIAKVASVLLMAAFVLGAPTNETAPVDAILPDAAISPPASAILPVADISHVTAISPINENVPADAPAPEKDCDLNLLGKSSERFAADIYQKLAKVQGNILVSPASLQTVLALVQMAAKGETLNEMSRALSLPIDKPTVQKAYKKLIPLLRNVSHSTLNSANKIYIDKGFDLNAKFAEIAVDSFDAGVESKDFKNAKKTTEDINMWIESQTNKKITDLIKEDMFDKQTVMVLVNALYFNGQWAVPFEKHFTSFFFTNATSFEVVNMMHSEQTCNFFDDEELDAKFVEVPYSGNEFTMTFILPKQIDGLAALEDNLHEVLKPKKMEKRKVAISIPKFKIVKDINCNDILKQLGMEKAFTLGADLSDFSIGQNDLRISHVVQKTFIDVNEKGTEAAAASTAFIDNRYGDMRATFLADVPFMFVLRQTSTGIVQFIGKFSTPDKFIPKQTKAGSRLY